MSNSVSDNTSLISQSRLKDVQIVEELYRNVVNDLQRDAEMLGFAFQEGKLRYDRRAKHGYYIVHRELTLGKTA